MQIEMTGKESEQSAADSHRAVASATCDELQESKPDNEAALERKLALIHRVLVPDEGYPKEYAILVTDRRLIFIRQKKTRSSLVLRYEMKIGTALVTDVVPKTLDDYEQTDLGSLAADNGNFSVPYEAVTSLAMKADPFQRRRRDFIVWATMNTQGDVFQVFNFELEYLLGPDRGTRIKFYMVPLGSYFKPRRQTTHRGTILREYALEALGTLQRVLPAGAVSSCIVRQTSDPQPDSAPGSEDPRERNDGKHVRVRIQLRVRVGAAPRRDGW